MKTRPKCCGDVIGPGSAGLPAGILRRGRKPRMPAESRRCRGAFTLLEVLLALTLMGTLLVALNVFVFSMAEVWGKGRDERLFLQHVRAVTNHVDETLRAAALGPAGAALEIKEVEVDLGRREPQIAFVLAEGGRLVDSVWPEVPLPDVELSFGADERAGLVLRWQSRLETRRDQEAPRAATVSPFVKSLAWDYYDDGFKRWETLDAPRAEPDGTYPVPRRLRLRFELGALKAERVIDIPVRGEGATRY